MGRALKLSLTAALLAVALVAFAFAACGKHGVVQGLSPGSSDAVKTSPEGLDYQGALTELDALACPDGVDAGLWAELKGALEAALACRAATCGPPLGPDSRPLGREIRGAANWSSPLPILEDGGARVPALQKIVSTPPTGEANRVNDLGIADNGDGTYTLTWHYRNLGDYDQNGAVSISDITPIAQHFGENVPEDDADRNSLQAVIDGSGNGKVDIEDVTPIAANIAVNVHHYAIEGADTQEGPWAAVGEVPQNAGTGDGRLAYEHMLDDATHRWYRVVPCDSEDVAGEPSESALSPLFQEWVHTWGGSGWEAYYDLALGEEGDVYAAGSTRTWGAGDYDSLLSKYDTDGNLSWQTTWGGAGLDVTNSVVVDKTGSVYLTGYSDILGSGSYDLVILKYDAYGTLVWQNTWGGSEDDVGTDIVEDRSGFVYVTGYTGSFGAGDRDLFLLKYGSDGRLLRQSTLGTSGDDRGLALVYDKRGNLYVTGYTDAGSSVEGWSNVLLLKYDLSGYLVWARTWGTVMWDFGTALAVDEDGNVYVTGYTGDFGGSPYRLLLLKYDPDGNVIWERTWGESNSCRGYGVAVKGSSCVYVSGFTGLVPSDEDYHSILLKFDLDGHLLWQRDWHSGDHTTVYNIIADSLGTMYLCGSAPSANGLWQETIGLVSNPEGTARTPTWTISFPAGSETGSTGVQAYPVGIIDEGAGGADALIMKIDPSRW